MSAEQGYGKIVTNGLVFAYDTGDSRNSYLGAPTTNLFDEDNMAVYDNVPGDVTVTLTKTSSSYKGAAIWKEVITPITETGISYLKNANNPGIGVYQGTTPFYTADGYTGCSIFFKPTVQMSSAPILNNYSNMNGWVAGNYTTYDDMGDGWFRAWTLWTSGSNGSDGKFWAINPYTSSLNVPIEVYWAGPFKEAQNRQWVSRYTKTHRSVSSSLFPLIGTASLDLSNVSFVTENMTFNGSNNYISFPNETTFDTQTLSIESICNPAMVAQDGFLFEKGALNTQINLFFFSGNLFVFRTYGISPNELYFTSTDAFTVNQWHHVVATFNGNTQTIYVNGRQIAQATGLTGTITYDNGGQSIGRYGGHTGGAHGYYFTGSIAVTRFYNRALTQAEVKQNFNAQKTRFGL